MKPLQLAKDQNALYDSKTKTLYVHSYLSVPELAHALTLPIIDIVEFFFLKGKMRNATANLSEDDLLEFCIAQEINIEYAKKHEGHDEKIIISETEQKNMTIRPPVVTIMGHVDHGKTTLLDYIRKAKVAHGESGGITQHIGAYQVKKNNQLITFIDTPGHEAFTKMRLKGSKVTDIVILVVSADDGVMPQTKESIDHAKNANVEIIVAVNKIDKPQADPERVKSELSELDLVPIEWGGKTTFVEISAKTGKNVDILLAEILNIAELLELKTFATGPAQGTIVESHIDPQRGAIVTMLVQKGQLKIGDYIACKNSYGKVKAIFDEHGKKLKIVNPSQPVVVMGLNNNPETGSILSVYKNEKEARQIAIKYEELAKKQNQDQKIMVSNKTLNLIIKADTEGSLEALKYALGELKIQDYKVNIIHAQAGPINNKDIDLAKISNSLVIGFHIRPRGIIREHAKTHHVEIKTYEIIYKLLEDIETLLKGLLPTISEEKVQGQAEVRNLFKASKIGTIAGCMVIDGVIKSNSKVRILREDKIIFTGEIKELRRFKDNVKEVASGFECGITIKNYMDIKVGDTIEAFEIIQKKPEIN